MKTGLVLLFVVNMIFSETTEPAKNSTDAAKDANTKPVRECNPNLLRAFKINASTPPKETACLVCPAVTDNCCSYSAQNQIVRLWTKGTERKTIVGLYRTFLDTYKKVFDLFTKVEAVAQTISDATAGQDDNPCQLLAKATIDSKFSALKNDVIKNAKKSFDFLYDSRKGFYCSLCDKNLHHLYNPEEEAIAVSYGFCSDMVRETLPFFLFKHKHFMKMSRLYGEVMAKCSIEGDYKNNEYLKSSTLFIKDVDYTYELDTCRENLAKQDAYNFCSGFCERFNPVRFDMMLEGDLDKLVKFAALLEKLLDSKVGKVKDSSKEILLNVTENSKRILSERNLSEKTVKKRGGRILADATTPATNTSGSGATATNPATATGSNAAGASNTAAGAKAAKPKNEFNTFNTDNGTALVRPITYDYLIEAAFKNRVSFDYSYIQVAHNTKYDVFKWITKLSKEGINFFNIGRSTNMTKEVEAKVFQESNPRGNAPPKAATDGSTPPATGDASNGSATQPASTTTPATGSTTTP